LALALLYEKGGRPGSESQDLPSKDPFTFLSPSCTMARGRTECESQSKPRAVTSFRQLRISNSDLQLARP
jgi:hypothetical protein